MKIDSAKILKDLKKKGPPGKKVSVYVITTDWEEFLKNIGDLAYSPVIGEMIRKFNLDVIEQKRKKK